MMKKRQLKRGLKAGLAGLLAVSWTLAGWPQIPFTNFPPEIEEVGASIASGGSLGSTNSEVANQTFIALTTSATAEAGNMIVVVVAKDNIGTTDSTTAGDVTSIDDTRSNSYTKAHEYTNGQGNSAAGAHVSVWFALVGTELASGDTITANFVPDNANDKSAIHAWEYTVDGGNTFQVADTTELANDGEDPGSISLSSLANQEWLFFRGIAYESDIDVSDLTVSTDYDVSLGVESTDGGGEAGNMGVTGEFDIVTATGTTSDPQTVGDTSHDNASVLIAFEEITPSSVLTQNDFEIFVDNDNLTPADAWPSGARDLDENVALTPLPVVNDPVDPNDEVRIRMNIAVTDTELAGGAEGFILQFAKADGCTAVPSWTDVGSGDWGFATSGVSNNTTLTSTVIDTSNVLGRYNNADPSDTNPNAVPSGQAVEWDWHVVYNGSAGAGTYCFRMRRDDPADLDAYEIDGYPKISTRPAVGDQLRHGEFFSSDAEQGFFWAE